MAAPERPLVTLPDLLALLRDELTRVDDEPFDEWVRRENVEDEALVGVTAFLTSTWLRSGESVEALALMAFTCGWAAHRDLRGERA